LGWSTPVIFSVPEWSYLELLGALTADQQLSVDDYFGGYRKIKHRFCGRLSIA